MKPLLISKCLLGENVRYDGGNCLIKSKDLMAIQKRFDLFPVCPEVMAKMGIPRDPIEICNGRVINKAKQDMTDLFNPVMKDLFELIQKEKIQHALLKDYSPSCGVNYIHNGLFDGGTIQGSGLITAYFSSLGIQVFSETDIKSLLLIK